MSLSAFLLIAFDSFLFFVFGLLIGYYLSKSNKASDEIGCFRESIELWKNAVGKIDDLTRRTVVQLGSFRERLTKVNKSLNDGHLTEPIDELMAQVCLLEKEIKDLKSSSKKILDNANGHSHLDLSEVNSIENPKEAISSLSDTNIGSFEQFVSVTKKKVELNCPLFDVLDYVYDELRNFIPCHRMGYAEIDYSTDLVTAVWARSNRPCRLKIGYSALLSESSLQFVAEMKKVRVLNNLPEYLGRHSYSQSTRLIVAEGYRSSLTLPIEVNGTVVAFLFISSIEEDSFDSDAISLAREIVTQISQSVFLPTTSRQVVAESI